MDLTTTPTHWLAYIRAGGPVAAALPARVRLEIDRREAAAERLIGWVQLAFVLFFVALYTIAPRAEGSAGATFVPATLAAYMLFTLFRLALSYRVTLPGWFLVLSMVVDVALLCGLIFSFHIQYGQPAAFYLKAPTMIYLFIFIALRVLRFDPRYVLLSGLIAVAGWLAMVAYALLANMGEMYITRNYVEYLTSNAILIGAEIDKVITLLAVTLILSFAQYRARAVFFDAIRSHTAAEDLSQFFAPEVARTITAAETLPGEATSEMRDAAILFVDVRGFSTTAATMPPEAVMQVLAVYQQCAQDVIARHGGRVDKFMGDGILATFGAVEPSETFAADALRAGREVITALDGLDCSALGWPGAFRTGAAVASGRVTVGVVGGGGRLEFTVIGNAVNLASKLETANKDQGTRALTDLSTLELAQAQGLTENDLPRRPATAIMGLTAPVDLVVLA
ncbi:MAG: adenylate/guanylate cyclase domain-containing protein [Gemmobacter sp.]